MKKILIIGAGAMGAAFTFPCLDNKHHVTLSEPYNFKLVKTGYITYLFHLKITIE